MQRLFIYAWTFLIISNANAKPLNDDLETAARIGVSQMLCDMNSGAGSGGWNHYIGQGADKMHISHEAAEEVVKARQREILTFLNRSHRLDEFCRNARAGRL